MPTSGEIERERRRNKVEIIITDFSKCYNCKSTGLTENDKFCPHCGFPQHGTQWQMKSFMIRVKFKKKKLEEMKSKIRTARNILYGLAILNLIFGLIVSVNSASPAVGVIVSVITAGIFFGLGLWCNKNPFAAILTGFFVFITTIVIGAVADPRTLLSGLVIRILIISAFVYGYKAAKDSQKMEKELEVLNTAVDLNEADGVPEMPA